MADLFITTPYNFEIWVGRETDLNSDVSRFFYERTIKHPEHSAIIGQSLFIDVELKGTMDLVTPVCTDKDSNGNCKNAALMVSYWK